MAVFHRDDHLKALRNVPIFRALDSRHLDEVARLTTEIPASAGSLLSKEGDYGRELMVLLEGEARVTRNGMEVGHLRSGDFFGEISLIDGKARTATITAETPCTLLVVESRALSSLMDTVEGLDRAIMLALCTRLREAYDALSN
jgi:CRP-like cAMP-binding protein